VSGQPWTFGEAHAAHTAATTNQTQAEAFVKQAYRQYAESERVYREALAKRITELRAEGNSVTLCGDLARGDKHVADLKYKRDVAEGVKEAAAHAIWRATADRRTVEAFTQWSMRRDLAEGYGSGPVQEFASPIGGRR
jgi:hypothetical protein